MQVGPPTKLPEDGSKAAKIKVKVRLNLHGIVGVESVHQIEEEEYEETVPKKASTVKVKPCLLTSVGGSWCGCSSALRVVEVIAIASRAELCQGELSPCTYIWALLILLEKYTQTTLICWERQGKALATEGVVLHPREAIVCGHIIAVEMLIVQQTEKGV